MIKNVGEQKTNGKLVSILKKLLIKRELVLITIIVLFSLVLGFNYSTFLSIGNLKATLIGMSADVIIAIGMCMVLITGEIDLSVGSILSLAGAVTGLTLVSGWPVILSILAGLTTGLVIGFINALVILKLKVNSFIATLGMQQIARGITVILAEGGIAYLPSEFTWIGQTTFLGFQLPVWIMLLLIFVFGILLSKHRSFRQLYYIGGNVKAATLSGINVAKVKFFIFILIGGLAGVAGVLSTARFGSAISTAGTGAELRVIAASVIGGCSLSGGEGSILGTFFGAVFMALISSALVSANVSVYWHSIVTGLVLVLAVAFDTWVRRNRMRFQK
jgi:ribose transport system permease protein